MSKLFALLFILFSIQVLADKCPKNYPFCRNLKGQNQTASFDAAKWLGVWYDQSRSANFYFGEDCYCSRANYTLDVTKTGFVNVRNTCNEGSATGKYTLAEGSARINGPCDLSVAFSRFSPYAPYTIILFDDVNYQWG